MTRRHALGLLAIPLAVGAQDAKLPVLPAPADELAPDYVCPMDPDIRSVKPGQCPRCGMKLILGIPDATEYDLQITTKPRQIRPGQKVELTFHIPDPKTGKPVEKFEIVHDKLFHMFIVSQDLKHFVHDHPELGPDHLFRYTYTFPQAGMYRILGDFYPAGSVPQLIARTVFASPGPGQNMSLAPANLTPELGPSHCANMEVELNTEPAQPIAGMKTLLFFKLKPATGLEKYLGAWGHMLAASDDLIDMIHTHPFIATGDEHEQFNVIFPRARTYRVWVQFQRQGVVNTAAFNIPVSELK